MSLASVSNISYNKVETPQVNCNNIFIDNNGAITFVDDGEITIEEGISGFPYVQGIPSKLDNSTIYGIGKITSDTDLSEMTFSGNESIIQTCELWFTTDSTVYTITWPSNLIWIDTTDGSEPTWLPSLNYRIVIRKEIDNLVASISYCYNAV